MYICFDASHRSLIEVVHQDFEDDTAREDIRYFGLEILTGNEILADVLGVEPVQDEALIRRRHLEAIRKGDHVFFMEMGKHSAYAFRICRSRPSRNWDSGCAGIVIVPREAWFNAFPRSTYAQCHVFKVIDDALSERVTAILNGWIYCAQVTTEDGDSFCIPGFLSAEEALESAMSEYPEIRYSEDDFEEKTVWKLKTANSGIMQGSAA